MHLKPHQTLLILALCATMVFSCNSTATSYKTFDELQDCVVELLGQDEVEFNTIYPVLKEYVDSLVSHSEYNGPSHLVRVESQRKSMLITSYLISKYEEYGEQEGFEYIVEELQSIRNKWVYVTTEQSPFFMHEHLYTSYMDTDDEVDDYFTFYVYPREKYVALALPFCAVGPPSVFFSESISTDLSNYSYYSFDDILEYYESDEDGTEIMRLMVIGGEDVLNYMLNNTSMIIYFRGDRPESDGYSGIEKALVNLEGLHQIFEEHSN